MAFPELRFGLFFLVVFTISWLLKGRHQSRIIFLVGASYVFYACTDWRFCFLLLGSSVFNWGIGWLLARGGGSSRRKAIVAGAVVVNLAVLGVFKYFGFFVDSANALIESLGGRGNLPVLSVVLPAGISFFTFHGLSYVVDLYRGKLAKPAPFWEMLLYISFFPQLVAGPIVRASHFLPQLARPVDPDDIRATRAFLLILGGLFKKVVVATTLGSTLVDPVFLDPDRYGALDLLLGSYGYALQIYCDFSAYTDIAIGVAALFGYRFPQNFDQPYRALGLRDFWKRWHISLSSWLRDYLYISLGGNRSGLGRTFNLMVTMLLGGLWHGAAWTFVIWGGLHGLALVVEHACAERWKTPLAGWAKGLAIVATFHWVCFAWIFFRAAGLDQAFAVLKGFARWGAAPTLASPSILTLLAGGLLAQFLPKNRMELLEAWVVRVPAGMQAALVGLFIVVIDSLGPDGVPPFIYFKF
jgi:D-alanyl-lipoteichoic acid acyltransferase DltB (MBOAT superfamily)